MKNMTKWTECKVLRWTARLASASVFVFAAAAAPLRASFEVQPRSVRADSMGGAGTRGEAMEVFTNPAGLGAMKRIELGFVYDRLQVGMADNAGFGAGAMALAVPSRRGVWAVGYGRLQAGGLKEEETMALSGGWTLGRVTVGLSGKYFSHGYRIGDDALARRDPIFSKGTRRSALGWDAAGTASLFGSLELSVAVRNINRPDVGLMVKDRLPLEVESGVEVDLTKIGLRLSGALATQSAGERLSKHRGNGPSLGVEKTWAGERVAMRFGAGAGKWMAGVGMRWGDMTLDYGVLWNTGLTEGFSNYGGTHRIGMAYRFGRNGDARQQLEKTLRKLSVSAAAAKKETLRKPPISVVPAQKAKPAIPSVQGKRR